ncbi:MAG: hypothetical protein U0575_15515 [Phycisphaerales bacterium]
MPLGASLLLAIAQLQVSQPAEASASTQVVSGEVAVAAALPSAQGAPATTAPPAAAPPATASPATAPPGSASAVPAHDENHWWFQPSLALWLPGADGTVGVRGQKTTVNKSFIDVLDDSSTVFGFGGTLDFGYDKIGGFINGYYAQINVNDITVPLGTADIHTDYSIMGFGVSYEIGRWRMGDTVDAHGVPRDLTLRATAGGRWTNVSADLRPAMLPSKSQSKGWVDPTIGADVRIPLGRDFSLVGVGDIGGFGAASQFTWSAALLFSWDFYIDRFPSSLQLGYLAVGDDYQSGTGDSAFVWDMILHGIILNWSVRF